MLGVAWLKPIDILRHLSIVFDTRHPNWGFSKGCGVDDVMVICNPKLAELNDFEEMKSD